MRRIRQYDKTAEEPALASGTTAQYLRGDKTWQTLNKTAVGLANVDNTADSSKPVSTAQQTALDLKVSYESAYTDLTSSSGVITIDLNQNVNTYRITLTENVTSWTFSNQPAEGTVVEFDIHITQHASSAKTCVSPVTGGRTAGGAWVVTPFVGTTQVIRFKCFTISSTFYCHGFPYAPYTGTVQGLNHLRAWVNFNGQGTVAINGSSNVSSITDNNTGNYTVNYTTAMPDILYAIMGAHGSTTQATGADCSVKTLAPDTYYLAGSCRIGTTVNGTLTDTSHISVSVFR